MFKAVGKCLGTKSEHIQTQDGGFTKIMFAISNPKLNGYEGEEEITEFQLTKKQTEAGLAVKLERLNGKKISVPCYNQVGVSKQGRAYQQWYISGDGSTIEEIK